MKPGAKEPTSVRSATAVSIAGTSSREARIAAVAARQYGIITRAKLLDVGLTEEQVKYRVRTKRLHPLQRGVYLVGPVRSQNARYFAALLTCGPGAVVSHRTAAGLWRLLPSLGDSAPVDIIVPGRHRVRRPGVRSHRVGRLAEDDVTSVERVPVTSPIRTILDLSGAIRPRHLEQALARAERRKLVEPTELLAHLARHPGRPGTPVLQTLLRTGGGPRLTRSEAENRFLALVRKAGLPTPETNVIVAGYEVDFLWRAEGTAVEVDGFAFHSARSKFEDDRLRDGELSARGLRVIRVTWRQMAAEPEAMLVRLAQSLTQSRLGRPPT